MNWDSCTVHGVAQISCLEPIFTNIVVAIAGFAAIVFLIMLLVGGFKYLTSAGNPKTVEAAKGTLTAAFLGLILIVGAYIILRLIASFTGITALTTFKVSLQ